MRKNNTIFWSVTSFLPSCFHKKNVIYFSIGRELKREIIIVEQKFKIFIQCHKEILKTIDKYGKKISYKTIIYEKSGTCILDHIHLSPRIIQNLSPEKNFKCKCGRSHSNFWALIQ